MTILIPSEVDRILSTLIQNGFEAYIVGGCVRDSLLARKPNDWDITTNAKPEEVKKLFRRTVDTGIKHGTVTVLFTREGYEVTTYRLDGDYADHRHPENVQFTSDLSEDLRRRDFTINAIAYNEKDGIVDLYGGQEDLEKKIIRAVGNPHERFEEDALRILRAVRFAAQLGFTIEEETYKAAKELSQNLADISKERIREELEKTLQSAHPEYVRFFQELGAMPYIYPLFEKNQVHIVALLKRLPARDYFRTAAFLSLGDDPTENAEIADKALIDLRYDNETRRAVDYYLRFLGEIPTTDSTQLRWLMHQYEGANFENLLLFYEKAKGKKMEDTLSCYQQILARKECTSLKELAITGKDLIQLGIPQGKELGKILNELLRIVIDNPNMNNKELLEVYASNLQKGYCNQQ